MPGSPPLPFSVQACGWLVKLAAWAVPAAQREGWKREWRAEIWHRWQFLTNFDLWSRSESLALLRRSCGAFPDALWCFADRESVRARSQEVIRSPWTCLGALGAAVALLGLFTLGFPATRAMLRTQAASDRGLVFIWFHPVSGAGDEGLPADAVTAWSEHSQLLSGVAPFVASHRLLHFSNGATVEPLVLRTVPALFRVLNAKPHLGHIPQANAVVLTYALWRSALRSDMQVIGQKVRIGRSWYTIAGVLPRDFYFLSRERAAYLIENNLPDAQQMVIARVKPGVSEKRLDKELTNIAFTSCYYFFRSQLRYSFLNEAGWIPFRLFEVALLCSGLLVLWVSRVSIRRLREFIRSREKAPALRRSTFFVAKTGLALSLVFLCGLEWSRSPSAILFGSRDPAAGPLLLFLYILGSMGVLFWAVADQRARCRVCLRLLCLPVRVGCPGCLLLNWSGTELLCPEGHGMMHVPDLTPSWEEMSDRWISLDESWKDLFAPSGPRS
ncbi:MAG TPA: ABC transporter permease [Bryobacteraceae bacterium]|jgi:hypothetical protein|nr:ABC transporter permease [Bryobacteraceae bacterium]